MSAMGIIRPSNDIAAWRREFPALERYAWFNTPGVPPAAQSVVSAMESALALWRSGDFDWLGWEGDAEECRRLFANLLGVSSDCVGLVGSLAEAASTVAESMIYGGTRGRVVVPAREFRSNYAVWDRMADMGFAVTPVSMGRAADWTGDLVDAITDDTVLVAMSDVQSATGVRASVPDILARCERVGARLFVNVTQSLGALAPAPWHAQVDYVAVHSYKWMLAPRGAAFLCARSDRLTDLRPLSPSWKSFTPFVENLYGRGAAYARSAARVDSSLAWLSWVGARRALELLTSLDSAAIEKHCLSLSAELRRGLVALAFDVVGEDLASQIVCAEVPDSAGVVELLRTAGVVASSRDGLLRFGCHLFNSTTDVARALEALEARDNWAQVGGRRTTTA